MTDISRRSFLRGATGATLALPWLEAPAAALGRLAKSPAKKMAIFYVPIGVVRRAFFPGEKEATLPKFRGFDEKNRIKGIQYPSGFSPIEWTPTLGPLKELQEHITFITGLDRTFQSGTDVHAQCASCFISSAAPFTIKTSAWPLDRTLDHLVADQAGKDTPFRTLEFSCNSHKDNKESIYFDNISWYGTGHVAPSLRNPRAAYRRMFQTSGNSQLRNITDLVLSDARSFQRELSSSDRHKFAEYFDSIRAIEERMVKLEKMRGELQKTPLDEPAEAYLPRGEYIRLMGDLMVTALQTGLTHVATLMIGPERWDTPYKYESLFDKPRNHHQMSHNQSKFVEDLEKVDHFHMEQFAYLIRKMSAVRESNGTTLLDNTILTYGSGLGDGATHQYTKLPIVVAGGRGAGLRPSGKHLNCSDGTPLANLWLTQARAMGLELPRFADSSGPISQLLG
jgi:hypothetical protein